MTTSQAPPHTTVVVEELPPCGVCQINGRSERPAWADAKLPAFTSWAYVCFDCFNAMGCTLGLGRGQRLLRRRDGE